MSQTKSGHPHDYSGEAVTKTVVEPCLYTHPDQMREQFPRGTYGVPIEVANSAYFQFHTNEPPPPMPSPGTPEHAEMMRKETVGMMSKARLSAEQGAMAKAGVDRANLEVQVRAEITTQIREEMRVELTPVIRAEVADEVRAEVEAQVRAELSEDVKTAKPKK